MRLEQRFGINTRRLRKQRGMTQEALAHEVEIDVSYLGQLERGERNPTLALVQRVAVALQVDAITLLTDEDGA